jgi:hypothetical protein
MYHNLSWKENLGKKWKMNAGISYSLNQDDIKAGMKDANKNDVILLMDLNSKIQSDLDANYYNAKLYWKEG